MAVQPQEKNRYHSLDLLRLLAALAVVFYHYSVFIDVDTGRALFGFFDLGYLGVNFFFMLSGFVIMASAQGRGAFAFLVARGQRLYPAFIACLGLTLLAIGWSSGQVLPMQQILANATLLNDYIKIPNVDGVYWTLQAEIKFYACVFLLSLMRVLPLWRYWLTLWCGAAVLHYFIRQPFFMGWFINPEYSFYFIGGVAAYLLSMQPRHLLLHAIFVVSMIFSAINAGHQIHDFLPHPSAQAAWFAQGIVIIFYAFFYFLAKGYFNLKNVPWWWVYLGAMSYPLYLLHNRAGKSMIDYFSLSYDMNLVLVSVIVALLIVSLLVHLLIETPVNHIFKFINKSIRK